MIKVLVVDDSALMRKVLGNILRPIDDLAVAFARDGVEAIAQLHAFQPDVVTLDVHMPRMDGLACLDRIMLERPCRVIIVSSLTADSADVTLDAMALGAVDFITKPKGAISLAIDEFGPELVQRIRGAAAMKLRRTLRLTERVRLQAGAALTRASPAQGRKTPAPKTPPPRQPPVDSILLIGTSTGGPPALDALLSPLPAKFPWPVLVAQHMPAAFTGPLARRLDRLCALRVVEVTRPVPVEPGTVYIGQGDADIIVGSRPAGLVAMAAPASAAHRWHPSVDRLVDTAMQHVQAQHLVGVLMTGMGNDGAAAMTRLHAAGGRTIAEAEETAVVWGMPGELVRAGGAEAVVPLDAIAARLLAWAS